MVRVRVRVRVGLRSESGSRLWLESRTHVFDAGAAGEAPERPEAEHRGEKGSGWRLQARDTLQ